MAYPIQCDFVISTPTNKAPSQETRTLIRRHAMKMAAAERRHRGDYGKRNLRQLPVFLDSPQRSETNSLQPKRSALPGSKRLVATKPTQTEIQAPNARARFERLEAKDKAHSNPPWQLQTGNSQLSVSASFSPLNLCSMVSLHLGLAKLYRFASKPTQLEQIFILPYGRNSILSFVPSRYGQAPSLTHAADCVAEQLKWIVEHRRKLDGRQMASPKYIKALKCLQVALGDAEESMSPETLFATELLAIFELLDHGSGQDRIYHAGGAARLIEHRGPTRFQTEFEKSLLIAHIGSIVTEALVNGISCFLAGKAWQPVLQSAVLPNDLWGERSDMVMSLWSHMVAVPGLFKAAEEHICYRNLGSGAAAVLVDEIHKETMSLLAWYKQHALELDVASEIQPSGGLKSDTKADMFSVLNRVRQIQLHRSYLTNLILLSRLLFALAPAKFSDWELRSQSFAHRAIALKEQTEESHQSIMSGLFGISTLRIAKATIQTEDQWRGQRSYKDGEVLDRHTFNAWCSAFGRKVLQEKGGLKYP